MVETSAVRDVDEDGFARNVLQRSSDVPVVVDFWAPWCGPCRALGPLLERLAGEAAGSWELVKVNVDDNPGLSVQFGVQGIPAVKGFRDGKVVAEFVGAQPERTVRSFLQRLLPSVADLAAEEGQRAWESGDEAASEETFRRALSAQPDHARALLGLGRLLVNRPGAEAEAERLLSAVPVVSPEGREAAGYLAQLRFARLAADLPAFADDAPQDDLAAHWTAGLADAASGDHASALEHLLNVVERNRRYRDGAAQAAMRDIFAIRGSEDPLTVAYQRRLARALFS